MKLTIELVPQTAWYSNVRSNVTKEKWDYIRKKCYKKAGYKCEICEDVGPKHPVECHEIWHYDDKTKKQTLINFTSLCPNCHKTKHAGLAQVNGEENLVINQLMKVNGLTRIEAMGYISRVFSLWQKRSVHKWELDISFMDSY